MQITATDNGSFVLNCPYEDRHIAKEQGCYWNGAKKRWVIPATLLNYERLKTLGWEFPEYIKNHMEQKLDLHLSFERYGFKMKTAAYEHQKNLTALVLEKGQCFFLCGMGTGKSKAVIDAISELHYRNEVRRCLIVSPASIMPNFQDEIEKHSYLESTIIYGSIAKRRALLKHTTPIHIINYEILYKLADKLIEQDYDMIVFDECHRLKNHKRTCKSSNAAEKIAKSIPYCVGLTGTLMANSYEDIFMPYKIISPEVFGASFTRFKDQYLVMGGYQGYQVIGYDHKEQFQKFLASNSLKYELDDVTDLPDEVEIIKKVELTPENKEIYKTLEKEFVIMAQDTERMTLNVLERLLRLSQISSGFTLNDEDQIINIGCEKLRALEACLEEINGKVIIWCRFVHSIKRVAALCESMGLSYYTYYGGTKDKSIYRKFNEDDTKVWIAQIQTGLGYSIPSAKYAIFYETDYSRINHVQSRGRNRRLTGSEKGSCIYIYLQAIGTIDTVIFRTLKNKDFSAKEALQYIQGGK